MILIIERLNRLARLQTVNNDPVITGMMTVGLILIKQSSSHIILHQTSDDLSPYQGL